MAVCLAEQCERSTKNGSRGFCTMHYQRLMRQGDPNAPGRNWQTGQCSIHGCDRPSRTRGWCSRHYNRWYLHGDPEEPNHQHQCAVCSHPDRSEIEARILGYGTQIEVVETYNVTRAAVQRHVREHLRFTLKRGGSPCPVCAHPDALLIDELLSLRKSIKASGRRCRPLSSKRLGEMFGLPTAAVEHHSTTPHQATRVRVEVARRNAVLSAPKDSWPLLAPSTTVDVESLLAEVAEILDLESGKPCAVDGCPNRAKSRGWCDRHYWRFRKHGSTELPPKVEKVCAIEGCDRKQYGRGWCQMHHGRWRRTGNPLGVNALKETA